MSMRTSIRKTCRVCNSDKLTKLETFSNYPLFDDIVNNDKKGTEYIDSLDIIICNDCNTLQNPKDIDFQNYYRDYVYSVGSSNFASAYMKEVVSKTLACMNLSKQVNVIDIGSSDGEFLSYFQKQGCRTLGFEGSSYLAEKSKKKGIATINSLFTNKSKDLAKKYSINKPDLVCLLHTFDHLPDPNQFLNDIKSLLDIGSYLLIEVHSLDKMIQKSEGAIFAHEHTCYYSEVTLKNLLATHDFEVVDYNFIDDKKMRGSSQVILCKFNSEKNHSIINSNEISVSTKEFILQLSKANKAVKTYINGLSSENYRVSGFGGWGRGIGSIAQAELTEKELYCVFDNNQNLNECYIPGTNIPIYSPSKEKLDEINEIIVFNYGYIEEIRQQILDLTSKQIKITSINEIRQKENSSDNLM